MKTIKIGAHDVALKFTKEITKSHAETLDLKRQNAMAMVDLDLKIIMIEAGLPVTVTLSSLMHEILHMANYQGGWGLFKDDDPDTEDHIEAMAESLTQVLVDTKMINPNFMAMLKRESAKKSK